MEKAATDTYTFVVSALVACAAFGGVTIRSDYPGGNVKVCGIDEANGVVRIAPDLRDTQGRWFHFSFPAARELGRNMLKALVRTAQAAEKP